MEIVVLVAVGLWLLLACLLAPLIGSAMHLGDDLWKEAREDEDEDWQWPSRSNGRRAA